MSYTPKQLREWADDATNCEMEQEANQLRAHADALEELTAEREKRTKAEKAWEIATWHSEKDAKESEFQQERAEKATADLAALTVHAEAMAYVVEEYWNGSENVTAMADALAEFRRVVANYRKWKEGR
jgi:hypothetical protein